MKHLQQNTAPAWGMKAISYVLSFYLLLQTCVVSAAGISNITIQTDLNRHPMYARVNTSSHQFASKPYIEKSAPKAQTLEGLRKRFENEHRAGLGQATYVPIMSGGITMIIPTYDRAPAVGTPLVQSRYIRDQIRGQIGRTLIKSKGESEAGQLNRLYGNAFKQAKSNDWVYGQPLTDEKASAISEDIIWPEYRTINGRRVLVPIVYLTQTTIETRIVDKHTVEFATGVRVGDFTVDGVEVTLGRDAYLKTAGNLINTGTINGKGNNQIIVGGALKNISATIRSDGDLFIKAEEGIENRTLVYRYNEGVNQFGYYGRIADIESNGDLILQSHTDINFYNATASAGGSMTLKADGSIKIGGEQVVESLNLDGQGGWNKHTRSQTHYLQSKLNAKDTIRLIAEEGGIEINAAEIISDSGHIEMLAHYGITIIDETEVTQFNRSGKFGKTSKEEQLYKTVAVRALLDAGKGVRLHSDTGNIKLKATDIRSQEGASISATAGSVSLLIAEETDHYSYSSIKKGLFTTKTVNRGRDHKNIVHPTVVGGLKIHALKEVVIQYEENPEITGDLSAHIDHLSGLPGLEWMAEVKRQNPDIQWNGVASQFKEWNKTNRSLSPAMMAMISIAVVAATGGAGATGLGGFFTGLGVKSAALSSAMAAGSISLINTAVVTSANAVLNGENPFEATWNAIRDDENLKGLASTMITAGLMASLDFDFLKTTGDGVNPSWAVEAATGGGYQLSLLGQVAQGVIQSTVSASVSTIVDGGSLGDLEDSFKSSLAQNAINIIGEKLANKIGAEYRKNGNQLARYVAHAAVGCLIGTANGQVIDSDESNKNNCIGGAGGAVIGELTADLYLEKKMNDLKGEVDQAAKLLRDNGWSDSEIDGFIKSPTAQNIINAHVAELRQNGINLAKFSAGLSALLAGADVSVAAYTAENAAANNAFMFIPLAILLIKAIDLATTASDVWDIYQLYASGQNDEAQKQLLAFLGDAALGVVAPPGIKTAKELLDWLKRNNFMSSEMVDALGNRFKAYASESADDLKGGSFKDAADHAKNTSRVRLINGRLPINSRKYAGKTVPLEDLPRDLRNKYPHSVSFTGDGFPDFSRYSISNVRIELGKTRGTDFVRADKAAGYSKNNPRPIGYTWHHHQDSGYMQLVPSDLHDAIKHTGGIATRRSRG